MKKNLFLCRLAAASAGLALAALPAAAAPISWLGASSSGLWSEIANWSPSQLPTTGSEVSFGGTSSFAASTVDYSVALSALTFQSDSQLFGIRVIGSGNTTLSFTGTGIQNLTGSTSANRQEFYANAGATGGTIAFTGSSGLNLGSTGDFRAVNVTALGALVAGDVGGHITFQDAASVGASTFNALRAEGSAIAGGSGGELVLRNTASTSASSTITVTGGSAASALGGSASFNDQSRLDGILNTLAGTNEGLGARATFSGNAVGGFRLGIANSGGTSPTPGSEAVLVFRDSARLTGSAQNFAALSSGARGGRIEFLDGASWDSTGLSPDQGRVIIFNSGARIAGGEGGRLVFRDDSFARGAQLVVINDGDTESGTAGASGGVTEFLDRSKAGQTSIDNRGAASASAGTLGGQTYFRNASSAGNASIFNRGGQRIGGAPGGLLVLQDDATASSANVTNEGASVANTGAPGGGGMTRFTGRSTAGSASITNSGGTVDGAYGGTLEFSGTGASAGLATIVNAGTPLNAVGGSTTFFGGASAANAYITNDVGVNGGRLRFRDNSTAGNATVDNLGTSAGNLNGSGQTSFQENATAGNSRITNFGGRSAASFGGLTMFADNSSAGIASIVNAGSSVNAGIGGSTLFGNRSTAGNASIAVLGGTAVGARAGSLYFLDQSNAGSARIAVDSLVSGAGVSFAEFSGTASAANATIGIGRAGGALNDRGTVNFRDTSTAANSSITVGSSNGGFPGGDGSKLAFFNTATAGSATISNVGAPFAAAHTDFNDASTAGNASITNGAGFLSGATFFLNASNAGNAVIVNKGSNVAGEVGGRVNFFGGASAGFATISSAGGGVAGFKEGGSVQFNGLATAGNALITAGGGTVAGSAGASTQFQDASSAGASTLTAESGVVAGAGGGTIRLVGQSSASVARVVLLANSPGGAGRLDIGGSTLAGSTVGSIEGGGLVNLGGKRLLVLSNRSTTFAGTIADGGDVAATGGSLSVVSAGGALTLTGANTYSGGTLIGDGINAASGKLIAANTTGSATGSGPVFVERGGTLGGSGFIDGPVTLKAGGTIAPGDPVTLTLRDSLTWDGGSVIRLVLGVDSAHSDHLELGSLIKGTAGSYVFDFVDDGVTMGASYDLIHFGSLSGFKASDFSFVGLSGAFDLASGTVAFTAAAAPVPEPSAALLFLGGLLLLALVRHKRASAALSRR